MKLLKNVLVKIMRGGVADQVLYIDNVPEELFYEMRHPRIIIGKEQQQNWGSDTTKPKIPTLYEKLSLSKTGDHGCGPKVQAAESQVLGSTSSSASVGYTKSAQVVKNAFREVRIRHEEVRRHGFFGGQSSCDRCKSLEK